MPFNKPSVVPESNDELDDLIEDHELSTAVGWAIKTKPLVTSKDEIRQMRDSLRGSFHGRYAYNWSLLLLCTRQVRVCVCVCVCVYVCLEYFLTIILS